MIEKGKSPQPVKFKSIEDFLSFLPPHELKIVEVLRQFILSQSTDAIEEKLSYNVPYYYRNKRLFFIWPSAVPWGKVKLSGVQLGFCYGHLLQDESNYLDKGNRKQVYTKTFFDVKEIDFDTLKTFIHESILIDQEMGQKG